MHPKKLLLTKWTAVQPVARQKHFVVTKVIEPETLELSNVDLTGEFASLINAQRSLQASSRIVTVSDSMVEDTVNLKR